MLRIPQELKQDNSGLGYYLEYENGPSLLVEHKAPKSCSDGKRFAFIVGSLKKKG